MPTSSLQSKPSTTPSHNQALTQLAKKLLILTKLSSTLHGASFSCQTWAPTSSGSTASIMLRGRSRIMSPWLLPREVARGIWPLRCKGTRRSCILLRNLGVQWLGMRFPMEMNRSCLRRSGAVAFMVLRRRSLRVRRLPRLSSQ